MGVGVGSSPTGKGPGSLNSGPAVMLHSGQVLTQPPDMDGNRNVTRVCSGILQGNAIRVSVFRALPMWILSYCVWGAGRMGYGLHCSFDGEGQGMVGQDRKTTVWSGPVGRWASASGWKRTSYLDSGQLCPWEKKQA